jgi:tetratricopeptide (TPR) repeat protein
MVQRGDWQAAYEAFMETHPVARFEWVAVDALRQAAECQVAMKQYEAAAATLDRIRTEFHAHWQVIPSIARRGDILLAGGKHAEATKAFEGLLSRAKDLGKMHKPLEAKARSLGLFGVAMVAKSRGDWGTVAAKLKQAVEYVDIGAQNDLYAQVMLTLGEAQAKSKDTAGALVTYKALRFKKVKGAYQAQAHLRAAELLVAKGKTMEAFDHAVMAALVRGSAVAADGKRLAHRLFKEKIDGDPSLSIDEKRAYKDYVNRL